MGRRGRRRRPPPVGPACGAAGGVDRLAPVPEPGKIVAVGLNYRDHAAEQDAEIPEAPLLFGKAPTAVANPGAPVVHPEGIERVDYEVELAVVVGRRARHVDAPVACRVNGAVKQDSTTAEFVFGVEELIEYVSRVVTLSPGDVIATGTPGGVGIFRDPPDLLEPGDTVEAEVEGIGTLRNPVVAE